MKTAKYRLKDHPWVALVVVLIAIVITMSATSIFLYEILQFNFDNSLIQTLPAAISNLLIVFIIVPFWFKIPIGKSNLNQYLQAIGLLKLRPFGKLMIIGLSCYIFFLTSQAIVTIIYRISQGAQVNIVFLREIFEFSNEFPPNSNGYLVALPSLLEEFVFRGIILTVFLNKYSPKKAILFSAFGFGLIHLLNLSGDKETIWVLGQVIWAFILGIFYGYLFIRTKSLLPVALVHYLINLFVGTITGYIGSSAPAEIEAFYGIVFSLGIVPTTLSVFWVKYFLKKWPIQ
jgi:membrane protease YdiL (CAAX protease family)